MPVGTIGVELGSLELTPVACTTSPFLMKKVRKVSYRGSR